MLHDDERVHQALAQARLRSCHWRNYAAVPLHRNLQPVTRWTSIYNVLCKLYEVKESSQYIGEVDLVFHRNIAFRKIAGKMLRALLFCLYLAQTDDA